MFRFIKKGWYDIDVIETSPFLLHPNYIETSRANIGNISFDEHGSLTGYTSGRAFPEDPSSDDPQAGLKLVWNYQYGFNAGDSETIHPFWWTYRNIKTGKAGRVLKFEWHFMN